MPKDNHANQDKCSENHVADEVHPMDALMTAKPFVVIFGDIFIHIFINHGSPNRWLS